jgi:hypothetical protein
VVAQAIQEALAPVLERLAALEALLEDQGETVGAVGAVRERVLVLETKALLPTAPAAVPIDLSPVLERVAAAEARLSILGDLRDRVVVIETKASALPATAPIDLPSLNAMVEHLVAPIRTTLDKDTSRLEGYTAALQRDGAALSERLAVLETRAPVPGPAGERGEKGRDGKDGRNGTVDELDMKCLPVSERSFQLYAGHGVPLEGGLITFDVELYRGVYQDGKAYERGDAVTWAGSEWHCNEPTSTKPGDGLKAWTLKVKRGRDGKDGRDAPGALPVVSVGGTR